MEEVDVNLSDEEEKKDQIVFDDHALETSPTKQLHGDDSFEEYKTKLRRSYSSPEKNFRFPPKDETQMIQMVSDAIDAAIDMEFPKEENQEIDININSVALTERHEETKSK